jgi:hypothetical protein
MLGVLYYSSLNFIFNLKFDSLAKPNSIAFLQKISPSFRTSKRFSDKSLLLDTLCSLHFQQQAQIMSARDTWPLTFIAIVLFFGSQNPLNSLPLIPPPPAKTPDCVNEWLVIYKTCDSNSLFDISFLPTHFSLLLSDVLVLGIRIFFFAFCPSLLINILLFFRLPQCLPGKWLSW